jgi:hypothetical protein
MSNNVVISSFKLKFTKVFPKMNNKNIKTPAPNKSNVNIINIINPTVSPKH